MIRGNVDEGRLIVGLLPDLTSAGIRTKTASLFMELFPLSSKANQTTRIAAGDAFLDPFSRPRVAVTLFAAAAALTLFFYLVPGIDIAVSSLFFSQQPCAEGASERICGVFAAASDTTLNDIRDFFHQMPIVIAVLLLIAAISISVRRDETLRPLALGIYVAVVSFVVNSLFIVNLWLKDNSGRPRPVYTDLFGGTMPFVPAGQFTEFCAGNCSFVSGESSAAFWMVGLSALFPQRWRATAMTVALVMASIAAGLRVAFGGHYFSDVVIAAVLSVATFALFATLARMSGLNKSVTASTVR